MKRLILTTLYNVFSLRVAALRILMIFIFIVTSFNVPNLKAQDIFLPKPGVRVSLSPPVNLPVLQGIKVHPDNPFRLEFILDKGEEGVIARNEVTKQSHEIATSPTAPRNDIILKAEANKLIKYFLASLTVPEKDLWVNLSPYEKDRIIPDAFGQTEMGRDLLAQDYLLKQITASLMYPEDALGKTFWKRVYQEVGRRLGTTTLPVKTFNKVWIVPEKAVVYENAKAGTAYVVQARLKVMLEEDYLAMAKTIDPKGNRRPGDMFPSQQQNVSPRRLPTSQAMNARASQGGNLSQDIIRELILPELEKEVNEGKNFSPLRQVYNSLILATWYKKKIKNSILTQVYADKNKVKGTEYTSSVIARSKATKQSRQLNEIATSSQKTAPPRDDTDTDRIYHQYIQAFKKGVYNLIKEEVDPISQQLVPRKYFSGGVGFGTGRTSLGIGDVLTPATEEQVKFALDALPNKAMKVAITIKPEVDRAMYSDQEKVRVLLDYLSIQQYYAVLGLEEGATLEEIKAAYKEFVRLQHPDSYIYPRTRAYLSQTGNTADINMIIARLKGKELPREGYEQLWEVYENEKAPIEEKIKKINEAYGFLTGKRNRSEDLETSSSAKPEDEQAELREVLKENLSNPNWDGLWKTKRGADRVYAFRHSQTHDKIEPFVLRDFGKGPYMPFAINVDTAGDIIKRFTDKLLYVERQRVELGPRFISVKESLKERIQREREAFERDVSVGVFKKMDKPAGRKALKAKLERALKEAVLSAEQEKRTIEDVVLDSSFSYEEYQKNTVDDQKVGQLIVYFLERGNDNVLVVRQHTLNMFQEAPIAFITRPIDVDLKERLGRLGVRRGIFDDKVYLESQESLSRKLEWVEGIRVISDGRIVVDAYYRKVIRLIQDSRIVGSSKVYLKVFTHQRTDRFILISRSRGFEMITEEELPEDIRVDFVKTSFSRNILDQAMSGRGDGIRYGSSVPGRLGTRDEYELYTGQSGSSHKAALLAQRLSDRLTEVERQKVVNALVAQGDDARPYVSEFAAWITPEHAREPKFLPVLIESISSFSVRQLIHFIEWPFPDDLIIASIRELGQRGDERPLLPLFDREDVLQGEVRKAWVEAFNNIDQLSVEAVLEAFLMKRGPKQFQRDIIIALKKKIRPLLHHELEETMSKYSRRWARNLLADMAEPEDVRYFLNEAGQVVSVEDVLDLARMNNSSSQRILEDQISRIIKDVIPENPYGSEINEESLRFPAIDEILKGLSEQGKDAVSKELVALARTDVVPKIRLRILYCLLRMNRPGSFSLVCEMLKVIDEKSVFFNRYSLSLVLSILAGKPVWSRPEIKDVVEHSMTDEQRRLLRETLVNLREIDFPVSFLEVIFPQTLGNRGPFPASDFIDIATVDKRNYEGFTVEVWNPLEPEPVRQKVIERIYEIIERAGFKGKEKMGIDTVASFIHPYNIETQLYSDRVILLRDSQGTIVAFAFFNIDTDTAYMGYLGYITSDQSKRGYGSILLTKVIRDLQGMGRIGIKMKVAKSTNAWGFYDNYERNRSGYRYESSHLESEKDYLLFPEYTSVVGLRSSYDFTRPVPFQPVENLNEMGGSRRILNSDTAMLTGGSKKIIVRNLQKRANEKGGIDLSNPSTYLQTKGDGGEIVVSIDPGALAQLKETSGFSAQITELSPLEDVPGFLGIKTETLGTRYPLPGAKTDKVF